MGSKALHVVWVLAAALVATAAASASPAAANRCVAVKPALATALRAGVKPAFRSALGTPHAVRSNARFRNAPSTFAKGAYFVSARVRGRGIATWAVNDSAFRAKSGVILPVGSLARTVGLFGSALSPAVIASWGFSARTDGYAQSRRCG